MHWHIWLLQKVDFPGCLSCVKWILINSTLMSAHDSLYSYCWQVYKPFYDLKQVK